MDASEKWEGGVCKLHHLHLQCCFNDVQPDIICHSLCKKQTHSESPCVVAWSDRPLQTACPLKVHAVCYPGAGVHGTTS